MASNKDKPSSPTDCACSSHKQNSQAPMNPKISLTPPLIFRHPINQPIFSLPYHLERPSNSGPQPKTTTQPSPSTSSNPDDKAPSQSTAASPKKSEKRTMDEDMLQKENGESTDLGNLIRIHIAAKEAGFEEGGKRGFMEGWKRGFAEGMEHQKKVAAWRRWVSGEE